MGLTGRAALALAATAVSAVGVSALLVERGLGVRVREASEQRLRAAGTHTAQLAAQQYERQGRWTAGAVRTLEHAAAVSGYRAVLLDPRGRPLPEGAPPGGGAAATAATAVRVGGRTVGRLRLEAPAALLAAEERDLRRRVMGLHLLAAALAVLAALLAVPLLAVSVVRPITRLREAVGGLRAGARAPERGPREVAELGAAFNALAAGLEREEEVRRVMVADVAHELRTPLNGMLLRIEAAQDGVVADPAAGLDALHSEVRRLARLVGDIESLAEAERPQLRLERERCDLARLVGTRAEAHAEAFAAAGLRVETALEEEVTADADPARLAQVVDNLLANALRYTDRGGAVTVRVAGEGDDALIAVGDTGIGIPPEDLPYVFDRFWRADRSRSRATGGAGVGLAVARRLVEAHGGSIAVTSRLGEGSCFTVRLPRAGDSRPAGAAAPAR